MTLSKTLIDFLADKQAAYKKLDDFVDTDTYFAYVQGVQDCIHLLQDEEERSLMFENRKPE